MDKPSSSIGARLRILLADDNGPFRQRVRHLLHQTPNLELVVEAGDGEEVVRMANELRPDIVVMDVVMPRLNGPEATRQITREFPAIKMLALYVYRDDGCRHIDQPVEGQRPPRVAQGASFDHRGRRLNPETD